MRLAVLIIVALLVAVASIFLADQAMRPNLSDYKISQDMSFSQVVASMRRAPDGTNAWTSPQTGGPLQTAYWSREGIFVVFVDGQVWHVEHVPRPTLLERLRSLLPSF